MSLGRSISHYVRNRLYRWPAARAVALRSLYHTEIALLHGNNLSHSPARSIIHFSLNKAATQYVRNILIICARENGVRPVQLNQYAWMADIPFIDEMKEHVFARYKRGFVSTGYCYTVFGRMVKNIPNFDAFLKLLMVRDPRDIIPSYYYSRTVSHPIPGDPTKAARFLSDRQRVRGQSVDQFALDYSLQLAMILEEYLRYLEGRPLVYITRYEDMISDFSTWLDNILAFCSFQISDRTRKRLVKASAQPIPVSQSLQQKRRQVLPGDHKRKLQPETISILNERFLPFLKHFGYECEP